jgi:hypothetical protein
MRNKDGTFAEGNSGKPKGAISERTRHWNEMGEWMKGEGMRGYQEELEKMRQENPLEFMKRYESMLEYFAPKLARQEVKTEEVKKHNFKLDAELLEGLMKNEWS